MPDEKQLRTKREVADYLKTTTRTIDRMRKRGKFPQPLQISDRVYRWTDQMIDEFLRERGAA